jgi:predicted transcriptional regulator
VGCAKEGREIFKVLFRKKSVDLLLALRRGIKSPNITVLTKEAGSTYAHGLRVLQELEKANLVELVRQRKNTMVRLTDTGDEVAESLDKIIEFL